MIHHPYTFGNVAAMGAAAVSGPPLPAFSNVVACYGLHNFNPVGYPAGTGVQGATDSGDGDGFGGVFTEVAPYPVDWGGVISAGPPAYLVIGWNDQNATNDLIQSGSARPELLVTSPVIVSGAGTSAANGTYRFTAIVNGRGSYNLSGTNPLVSAITFDDGLGVWNIFAANGDALYIDETNVSFPWQGTWNTNLGSEPPPTVAAGAGQGEIDFNGSSTGLATAANVTLGVQTATFYIYFKAGSLAETSVLFETGSGAAANVGAISVRMVAGTLTVSCSDQTAVVALLNTKVRTIADSNWHLLSVVIDTTAAVNANQVLCWLDGSATGWTSTISTDLSDENLTTSKFNFGARNNAASTWFTGSATDFLFFNAAQNNTLRGQWEQYIISLHP